jgi:hypothetical protein
MKCSPILFRASLVLASLALPPAASAQGIPGAPDLNSRRGAGNGSATPNRPEPLLSTAARVPWPRLDQGAVVCRTRDDLRMHAEVIQARARGTPYAGPAPDCRILGTPVAIDIVTRESPAATEVKLKDPPVGTGWTDTYLPSRPPR